MSTSLTLVIIALLFSAFFSGIEIAYVSANKLRIELQKENNLLSGRILAYFVRKPSHFLTATLIGNNIALVVYGYFMALLVEPYLKFDSALIIFLLQTIIASIVVLLTAEFLPKALFRINPNKMLNIFSLPIMLTYYLFYPLILFVVWLSRNFLKIFFKIRIASTAPVFGKVDLFHFIQESKAIEDESELDVDPEIFKNALDFAHVKVRDCMIPRTEIEALENTVSLDELRKKFTETGHSKILIYKESIDNVIGYVHIVDMFRKPDSVDSVLLPIIIATEAMPANHLLKKLIDKRRSIAIVVDEFGGTSGIVTMEDMIEEIFGEIEDEHDSEELREEKVSDTEFIFSARMEVDYINEEYNLALPEGDYETLGGLLLSIHQSIPQEGEVIDKIPYRFTILSAQGARIGDVHLQILDGE